LENRLDFEHSLDYLIHHVFLESRSSGMNNAMGGNNPVRKVIVMIASNRELNRAFWRGILAYSQQHGPWVFYEEPPLFLNPFGHKPRLERMKAWGADGLIASQSRIEKVAAWGLPSVVRCNIHSLPADQHQVRADDEAIGIMAADHLLGLGFKSLAYCGLAGLEWATLRGETFRRRAAKAGVRTDVYNPGDSRRGRSRSEPATRARFSEERQLGDWLAALPKPIGLLACNDERARVLAEICRVRAIQVPDEIAILGIHNDEHVCNRATPPLSSVALNTEQSGYEAAAMLDALMSGRPVRRRIILIRPVGIVSRQSTDLIAVNDVNLIKALRFIRDGSNRLIQVRDVAAVAGLSRRMLQDRFRRSLGRTVLEEIHRSRVDYISRLLAETDLTVSAIASALGYEMDAHLARFFARKAGHSPSSYRRIHGKKHGEQKKGTRFQFRADTKGART
jgi:LacI family transcriptional regulator